MTLALSALVVARMTTQIQRVKLTKLGNCGAMSMQRSRSHQDKTIKFKSATSTCMLHGAQSHQSGWRRRFVNFSNIGGGHRTHDDTSLVASTHSNYMLFSFPVTSGWWKRFLNFSNIGGGYRAPDDTNPAW